MLTIDEYYGWIHFSTRGPRMCGCGRSDDLLDFLHGYLKQLASNEGHSGMEGLQWLDENTETDSFNLLRWLFNYWIDNMGIVEHGSSAQFPWLTAEGYEILEAMDRYGTDLSEIEKLRVYGMEVIMPSWCKQEREVG